MKTTQKKPRARALGFIFECRGGVTDGYWLACPAQVRASIERRLASSLVAEAIELR
jgi:hypothetical protein